jgi:hypothetical protein
MITQLILENFKAFSGRHEIPFGRLTLIFGRNSSGKSSIIQSLMFIRQSMAEIDRAGLTMSQGPLGNFGSGRQILSNQDIDVHCEITPVYDSQSVSYTSFQESKKSEQPPAALGAGYVLSLDAPNIELKIRERRYYADSVDHVASTPGHLIRGLFERENAKVNPDSHLVSDLFVNFGNSLSAYYTDNIASWKVFILDAITGNDGADLREALLAAGSDFFEERIVDEADAGFGGVAAWIGALRFFSPHPVAEEDEHRHRTRLLLFLASQVPEAAEDADQVSAAALRLRLDSAFSQARSRYEAMSVERFASELIAMRLATANRASASMRHRLGMPRWLARESSADTVVDRLRARMGILDVLRTVAQATDRATYHLRYIGPVRSQGQRFEEVRVLSSRDVGKDGRAAVQLLADDDGLRTQANEWLERLEINYRMAPARIETSRGAPILDARIVDRRNDLELNLVDVGFGVSQIVPIVVQSLLLIPDGHSNQAAHDRRDTLLIEQPELHLHPAMQAEVGSLFAEVISASSTAQIIAETHSEALILRVMKLIRIGKLDAAAVKVLWVDQDGQGHAFVRDLPIDASGEFEVSWPRGFFSERYAEMED